MREDLASMGGSITDEDFTSVILGSIPQSYDTYIAAITATSTLLDKTLLPTNLISAIRDKADRHTIKNPKSKKDESDAAFMAGQSTGKEKKGGENSKKCKRGVKCYNCKKIGHIVKDCWASGGGAEGKGPKGKGKEKEKEVAAKVEDKGGSDSDAMWMVSAGDSSIDEVIDKRVTGWLHEVGGGSGSEYDLWTEDEVREEELSEYVYLEENIYSPVSTDTEYDDSSLSFEFADLLSETSILSPSY